MKRSLSLVAVLVSTICTLFSASIHHKVEFTPDELEIYKYNKYHEDKSNERIYSNKRISRSTAIPYTHLLEVGKEWKYNIFHGSGLMPEQADEEYSIKITDCVDIDGDKYYSLEEFTKSYYRCPDLNDVYLTEDIENRKVYRVFKGDTYKELIYDFNDPLKTWGTDMRVSHNDVPIYDVYSYGNNEFNSYIMGEDSNSLRQIEGIGIVSGPDAESNPYWHNPGCLLYPCHPMVASENYLPIVYEVVNGDGEVIYSLDTARPGYLTSAEALSADCETITITDASVEISGSTEIGSVMIFNTLGNVVKNVSVTDTHCSIPTADLAPGVYVVQTAHSRKKFTVK
ncbi:MAG: T9SS type A sorting domain-containing protein [Bacteroidales bacterium]|nr:T9SS type A sorting domain-containing protein [Bacteroidales bacterium]